MEGSVHCNSIMSMLHVDTYNRSSSPLLKQKLAFCIMKVNLNP